MIRISKAKLGTSLSQFYQTKLSPRYIVSKSRSKGDLLASECDRPLWKTRGREKKEKDLLNNSECECVCAYIT